MPRKNSPKTVFNAQKTIFSKNTIKIKRLIIKAKEGTSKNYHQKLS